jgi:hypothetical protein
MILESFAYIAEDRAHNRTTPMETVLLNVSNAGATRQACHDGIRPGGALAPDVCLGEGGVLGPYQLMVSHHEPARRGRTTRVHLGSGVHRWALVGHVA